MYIHAYATLNPSYFCSASNSDICFSVTTAYTCYICIYVYIYMRIHIYVYMRIRHSPRASFPLDRIVTSASLSPQHTYIIYVYICIHAYTYICIYAHLTLTPSQFASRSNADISFSVTTAYTYNTYIRAGIYKYMYMYTYIYIYIGIYICASL